ncbi:MAG: sugar-binding protein [Gelidibacter sp.]
MQKLIIFLCFGILISSCRTSKIKSTIIQKPDKQLIEVYRAKETPTIDGIANEPIWTETSWHPIDQRWIGTPYDASDFQGRYKLTWTDDSLYILAEIIDDTLFDQYQDPLKLWWDDDCLEVFIDEDNSGGEHQYNYNAFAYHIALDGNVVDMSPEKVGKLYNNHVQSKHTTTGNTTIWELKLSIYDDAYKDDGDNKPVTLKAGKKIGFAIAYCDNDSSVERENFIGSIPVEGDDKNRGWIDANIFGTIQLQN